MVKDSFYERSMKRMMTGKYKNTECGFLKDMTVHHDIAVVMAKDVFRHTKNPRILDLTRSIIHVQQMEIALMRQMQWSYCHGSMTAEAHVPTWLDQQFGIECKGDCGWGPFKEVYHPVKRDDEFHLAMKRMDHLFTHGLNKVKVYKKDEVFLKDMIIHHQIAVEMALHTQGLTRNPELLVFLRQLIWNQSKEIWHMRMILRKYDKSFWMSHSNELGEIEQSKYSFYLPNQSTSKEIEQDGCYLRYTQN